MSPRALRLTVLIRGGRRRLDGRQRLNFLRDFYGNASILGVRMHVLTHHEYIGIPGHPVTPLNGNASLLDYTGEIARAVNATLAPMLAPAGACKSGRVKLDPITAVRLGAIRVDAGTTRSDVCK
jgi:hypothetical protein